MPKLLLKELKETIRDVVKEINDPYWEERQRWEAELAERQGRFLVFGGVSQLEPDHVEVFDNMLDVKDAMRGRFAVVVRELDHGYSEDEFEPGIYSRAELLPDDDFFWTPENHPRVKGYAGSTWRRQ